MDTTPAEITRSRCSPRSSSASSPTIKRFQGSGLLASADTSAPRTGAKRKKLSLTTLGEAFLAGASESVVDLSNPTIGSNNPGPM